MKTVKTLLAAASLSLLALSTAHAEGFLGGIINQFAPGVGTSLDRINDQLGNPVDHAAAAVLDVYVPGAGSAVEAGWALQRSGVLNTRSDPPPPPPSLDDLDD